MTSSQDSRPKSDRVKREKKLTPGSDKRFNGILLGWFLSGYILALLVNISEISFPDCDICLSVSSHLPSIHKMAIGSSYPDAMNYAWLYYILSAPLTLILFLFFVQSFNQRILPGWGVILLIAIGVFGVYVCYIGMSFGSGGGGFSRLYHENLFYSVLVSFSFNAMIVTTIFFLIHHFIGIFNNIYMKNRR